jgi:hypothetical protein
MTTITDHVTYDHGNTELGALRAIAHLAATLHDRQHAGLSVTPVMWHLMYKLCNEAKALRSD